MNVSYFYINVRIFNWAETSNYFYFFHDKNLLSLYSGMAVPCRNRIGEQKEKVNKKGSVENDRGRKSPQTRSSRKPDERRIQCCYFQIMREKCTVYHCVERPIKEKEFIQDVRRGKQFARFWIGMTMLINIVAIIAALFLRGIGRWK